MRAWSHKAVDKITIFSYFSYSLKRLILFYVNRRRLICNRDNTISDLIRMLQKFQGYIWCQSIFLTLLEILNIYIHIYIYLDSYYIILHYPMHIIH